MDNEVKIDRLKKKNWEMKSNKNLLGGEKGFPQAEPSYYQSPMLSGVKKGMFKLNKNKIR